MAVRNNRSEIATVNQQRERSNLTSEKSSFAVVDWTNDIFSLVRNYRTGKYVIFSFGSEVCRNW